MTCSWKIREFHFDEKAMRVDSLITKARGINNKQDGAFHIRVIRVIRGQKAGDLTTDGADGADGADIHTQRRQGAKNAKKGIPIPYIIEYPLRL